MPECELSLYVSASGCRRLGEEGRKGGKEKARKEGKTEFLSL